MGPGGHRRDRTHSTALRSDPLRRIRRQRHHRAPARRDRVVAVGSVCRVRHVARRHRRAADKATTAMPATAGSRRAPPPPSPQRGAVPPRRAHPESRARLVLRLPAGWIPRPSFRPTVRIATSSKRRINVSTIHEGGCCSATCAGPTSRSQGRRSRSRIRRPSRSRSIGHSSC